MAYDEAIADRVRDILAGRADVVERKMFGGLAFLLRGHMACGVLGGDLIVRVGADRYEEALFEPHARPMDFTGRPMRGFVVVAPEGFAADADLQVWVQRSLDFVVSLPPKA